MCQLGPAEHGFPGRHGLVQPAHAHKDGGLVQGFGVLRGLQGDVLHGRDELVHLLLALALGGLDHQRAVDDGGEIDGGRMEPAVDEALGHVQGVHVVGQLAVVQDDFVQGRGLVFHMVDAGSSFRM